MQILKGGDDTGINFKEWLRGRLNKGHDQTAAEGLCLGFMDTYREVYIRELAFWSAVNMIANAISKCEIKTYRNLEEHKGPEYWLWNYSPNNNQNSSAFFHKFIGKLYRNNEALIVERSGQLLVADSFSKTQNAVRGDVFSDICVENLALNANFRGKDVLYFKLNHKDMYPMLSGLNAAYTKLLQSAQSAYQWGMGRHGKLNIGTMKAGDPDGEWMKTYNTLLTKYIKPFMEGDNGVLPVFNGYDFQELDGGAGRSQQTTRDIRALIDDVFEITAKALSIPAVLLKGEVAGTKDAIDNFLTFCIDPLCDQIQEEVVRKRYGPDAFANGDYLRVDTTAIKHFDLFDNAESVDKLISSGAFSVNDIRVAAGETPIDADFANRHFITKNYMDIEELTTLGGK